MGNHYLGRQYMWLYVSKRVLSAIELRSWWNPFTFSLWSSYHVKLCQMLMMKILYW